MDSSRSHVVVAPSGRYPHGPGPRPSRRRRPARKGPNDHDGIAVLDAASLEQNTTPSRHLSGSRRPWVP